MLIFAAVKRIFAISLLCITLFSQTEFYQFLKLPILFKHFTEHRANNHSISFAEFLVIHYVNPDQNDADHDRDKQLPFKSNDCIQSSLLTVFIPANYSIEITAPAVLSIQPAPAMADWVPSIHVADIWQPPRIS